MISCVVVCGKPSTVLLLTALSVSVFQSFTGLGKKECVYISVVAESTLICLLLDVLDGRWLYWYRVVSPRKVSRLASLNRYYIIIDEQTFTSIIPWGLDL
jgi:hypothetical protein